MSGYSLLSQSCLISQDMDMIFLLLYLMSLSPFINDVFASNKVSFFVLYALRV